ncbi:Uncharacterised protein [Candidatus Norongarragalina meridionalis]|nr:Uncharacterised protein [Candidatus Norongarragalina meridionalis]
MADWIQEYFINPLAQPNAYAPYNIVNTAVFAALALAAAFLLYYFIKKLRVRIDARLFYAIIPFIFFGSALRVWQDAGWLPRVFEIGGITLYPFVTPEIYVLVFLVLVVAYLLTRNLESTRNAGILLAAITVLPLLTQVKQPALAFGIVVLAAAALALFIWLWWYRGLRPTIPEKLVVFSQSLDGAASFLGIQFGNYFEQHLVGGLIMGMSPIFFFLVKAAFGFAVVELLRNEKEEERNYIMLLIMIFGLAPGLRDLLRIACGV